MLPIDELIRKADTTSTGMTKLIPQLWAAQLETNLREWQELQQSIVVNTDLLGTAGDKAYVPTLPDLDDSNMDLTEGTPMTVYALNDATSIPLEPLEKGKAIGITRFALDRMKYDGMAAIVDRLAYAMTMKIEHGIAALWNKTVPGGAAMTDMYPNGHASGTVVAGDVLNSDFLVDAVAALRTAKVQPFPDGFFRLYMHPQAAKALLKDSKVRDDIHFGSPQVMFRGEIGVYHNCRLIESTWVANTTNEGAGANETVYKNLLVAPRWAAIAYKRMPEIIIDPTVYDFGRRRQVAITADLDIELLHNERGLVLSTVAV